MRPSQLLLQVRPGSDEAKRKELLEAWYRDELRRIATVQMTHWMPIIGVQVDKIHIQHMKTKWGSCNPAGRAIRLNTELAKKPRECLEYILVHELVHLLEPSHNQRFLSLMDQFLPSWREHRDLLNHLPVCHEEWGY